MIDSTQNKLIKQIAALSGKKGRDEQNAFVVESEKLIKEIPAGWLVRHLIVSETYAARGGSDGSGKWTEASEITVVSDRIFQKLSGTVTPQGILAVCEKRTYTISTAWDSGHDFFLMAENLADPGNAGAMARTAQAAGAGGFFLSKGSVDMYNPKVIRSAAGSLFRLPFYEDVDIPSTIGQMREKGVTILAAHLKGGTYPYAFDLTKPCCILIGNEANGLTDKTAAMADARIKIPMPGQAESLNASVAGGILLYEVVRQRMSGQTQHEDRKGEIK